MSEWLPSKNNLEDYLLLIDMLAAQRIEFDLLSKKKADGQLNSMKIKMINRVLDPLYKLFKQEPSHMFLDLLDKDDMPTNSDVVLILSQYETAIKEFEDRYERYDEFKTDDYGSSVCRWMTKEEPPDFYAEDAEEEV